MTKTKIGSFRTNYNQIPCAKPHTTPKGKSQTIQGDTYSIKELMVRAAASGAILNAPDGLYIDAELDEITSMYRNDLDMHDLQQLREHVQGLEVKIKTQIETENRLKQEAKLALKENPPNEEQTVETPKEEKKAD